MLRKAIAWRVDREAKSLGMPLDYVHYILRHSLSAFFRFIKIGSISGYRKRLPAEAAHISHLLVADWADCGACVQIAVNMAAQEKVPVAHLQAAAEGRREDLPSSLQLVYDFTQAVLHRNSDLSELRDRILQLYGSEGLIELSFSIGSGSFYPLVKRTLGFGDHCEPVRWPTADVE